MGYKLLQTCIDCELPGLSDSEWRTLLVICRHADDVTGGNCHPSTQTICKKSRLTEKVVRKAIQSLEVQGWIRTSQNPGAVRFFEINVAKINDCSLLVGEKERPRAEVQGDVKERPRAEVSDAPVQKCTPSPCKSAPLREHIKEQEKTNLQTVDDSPFSLEPDQPQAATVPPAENTTSNTAETATDKGRPPADAKSNKPPKRKAITHLFELEAIPDEWRELCEQIRPDLDPRRVFVEFRFYWTQGKGQGTRRSDKGWTSTWMNWVKRQKEDRTSIYQAHTEIPFSQRDYTKGINDDNSI